MENDALLFVYAENAWRIIMVETGQQTGNGERQHPNIVKWISVNVLGKKQGQQTQEMENDALMRQHEMLRLLLNSMVKQLQQTGNGEPAL
ncbi:hypothetical protein AVEN_261307-1 [Araneus ventricosus]|uniref:Uncharacterized protein n=1 Tax=Araneus ventricosus TaxID=182803 RepID=A0A4Y2SMU6_ARAVE|nr:hypothetical protein AVEN_261307-1 [Araneus ventricosus]